MRPMYGGRGGTDIVKWFRGKMEAIEKGNSEAMKQAVEEGAEVMRDRIRTSGTGRQWSRPDQYGRWNSDNGRIASGDMIDAVEAYHNETGRGNVVARFGWLRGRKDYFRYQEGGFEHPSGLTVEGMYAVSDAYEAMKQRLEEEIRRNMNGA